MQLAKPKLELKLNLLLYSCLRSLVPEIRCMCISQMTYKVNCPEHLH